MEQVGRLPYELVTRVAAQAAERCIDPDNAAGAVGDQYGVRGGFQCLHQQLLVMLIHWNPRLQSEISRR
ncbi:hypothetical protein D3C84_829290 [compost metagenome]